MAGKPNQGPIRLFISSIIPAFFLLRKNDPLRLAGATAFFTTFALPPIVFILARLFGLLVGPKIVGRGLIGDIAGSLGNDEAEQVRHVIRSIHSFNYNWYIILFGFLFLVFVATTLFMVIKNSLNQIWQIKMTKETNFSFGIWARARSFAIILLVGILFFADLFFKTIETLGGNYFQKYFNYDSLYFRIIVSEISSVIIVSSWFIILFRFLADGKPAWRAAIAGGLLTGILFIAGRWLLKILLINSNIGKLYGSSGPIVLVLLFVFYTSFIMYYGACFIAVYSEKKQWPFK
jgi:membrane protein